MYDFIMNVLKAVRPSPIPLKEPDTPHVDFPSLCMTFLSHELNRATYSLGNDIAFQQIPVDIAIDALRDKALFSPEEITHMIEHTFAIHEQRYQNLFNKKKTTYQIMTLAGCEQFLKTGYSTDHFVGFRAFTPAERQRIFGDMLRLAQENPHFSPLLLKKHAMEYKYNMECYEKLGVSLDVSNTDYDVQKGYRSVFLMYPDFTRQYLEYYLQSLVAEKCYPRARSLQLLQEMYDRFVNENNLPPLE